MKESQSDHLAKLLLKPFILKPYKMARRIADKLIRTDLEGFHIREAKRLIDATGASAGILDVGSGFGYLGESLTKLLSNSLIVSTDVENLHHGTSNFVVSNAAELPFADNSFNVVTLFYVLHHTLDPEKMLTEAIRVSKEKVVIQEDAAINFFEFLVSWLHIYTWENDWPLSEIKVRNDSEWKELFNKAGLSLVKKENIQMIGLPIHRYLYLLNK